jgi:16S rRNA (cytidine1402-2'-O)-methyltransferase
MTEPGVVVLVGTPIGNLGDLSPNAAQALADADVVACEDTRRTRKLLTHAGIHGPALVALNAHNERQRAAALVARVVAGETVAVVTDAGMPGISDPGETIVAAAVDAGVDVRVVPGPSAVLAALVVSGLPLARFCFEGFLPRKGAARNRRLELLAGEPRTTVLFEAPHRIAATLADLHEILGPARRVAVARELTKVHEEVWRGTLRGAVEAVGDEPRGEFVVVVDGAPPPAVAGGEEVERELRERLAAGMSTRDAVSEVSAATGASRRVVYEVANRLS